jgi:hypothetical protein
VSGKEPDPVLERRYFSGPGRAQHSCYTLPLGSVDLVGFVSKWQLKWVENYKNYLTYKERVSEGKLDKLII